VKINKFVIFLVMILGSYSQIGIAMNQSNWLPNPVSPGKDSWVWGDTAADVIKDPIKICGVTIAYRVIEEVTYNGIADQVTDQVGRRIELSPSTKIVLGGLALISPVLAALFSK
jgi:hypothetical protein